MIALLKYVQENPTIPIAPNVCTKEHYADVRENRKIGGNKYSKEYTALIGYCASYGGRYFDGGYARDNTGRNMYLERVTNLREQAEDLKNISFKSCDYKSFKNYTDCLFWIDPPYKGTKQYSKNVINYDEFYDFCRHLSQNNIVLISEYEMPNDFKCIWEKERKVMQKSDRIKAMRATERLFILN